MLASKLIELLQEAIVTHGDKYVAVMSLGREQQYFPDSIEDRGPDALITLRVRPCIKNGGLAYGDEDYD